MAGFLDSLKKLFGGSENVASLELTQLDERRFALAAFRPKLVNIAPDISADSFPENIFKCLISGDSLKCEKKYKAPVMFENTAKKELRSVVCLGPIRRLNPLGYIK